MQLGRGWKFGVEVIVNTKYRGGGGGGGGGGDTSFGHYLTSYVLKRSAHLSRSNISALNIGTKSVYLDWKLFHNNYI